MSKQWRSHALVVLLVLAAATAFAVTAAAYIPEYDDFPGTCDGPCMGSNDDCCDPGYGTGGDGGGTSNSCNGWYCQYFPAGPNGEPSFYGCQTGAGEWDNPYNECSNDPNGGYCTLNDPCSSN